MNIIPIQVIYNENINIIQFNTNNCLGILQETILNNFNFILITPLLYESFIRTISSMNIYIKRIFFDYKHRYGSPRIARELKEEGITCSKNRVCRLMRLSNLLPKVPFL